MKLAVQFNSIPSGVLTPFSFIEFSAKYSGTSSTQPYTALIYGQASDNSAAKTDTYEDVVNLEEAKKMYGEDSDLYKAILAFRTNDSDTKLVACAQKNNNATATTVVYTLTGTATDSSTVEIEAEDKSLFFDVAVGDTAANLAKNISDKINAGSYAFTAAVNASTLTLTSKTKGKTTVNLYTEITDLPAGITANKKITAGTGTIDLTNAINKLNEISYNIIISCYNDDDNLKLFKTALDDRWNYENQLDGILFTHSENLKDKKNPIRSKYISYVSSGSTTRPCVVASAYAAVVCKNAQIDTSRPFQTLEIKSVNPIKNNKRLNRSTRNNLIKDGFSTYITNKFGEVLIERAVTSYIQDDRYRDINTLLTLSYLRYDFRRTIQQKYPRHKIATDGTRIPSGQPIITPTLAKAEALAVFNRWEDLGLVQNVDELKSKIIVEIDTKDKNRLNWILPTDLINQLRVTAAQIAFEV